MPDVTLIAEEQSRLFGGVRTTGGRPAIGEVTVDAFIEEIHTTSNEVTRYPVEDGADITDHIRPQPDGLRVTGQVSNQPLSLARDAIRAGDLPSPIRAQTAYAQLLELSESGQTITVVTSLRDYEDMAIENIEVPRNAALGNVVRFTMVLTRVRKVETKAVPAPEVERAEPKVNRGKQPAQPAPEPVRQSALFKVGELKLKLPGFFGG